ncbi:o-succinylbenzoate--CoA ligase [Vibrio cincinnatiensis]|uniref:o-succinylbenzoate--CoA ligase n=1 Tax=Vibrio cincinnatiensis TaxID=675 RepID=UPI001EDDF1C6|nr:o-succinylbenzoate--CoA ligase [Vibrio cincinnatiensis]MCG3759717.1 o-succinylbenzoate--CoA ligase [Vibrio cincinnatiensis]MCG3763038.1 o-succinylbenzoate--CoA ligase [Vibrio cincinnatiensis]
MTPWQQHHPERIALWLGDQRLTWLQLTCIVNHYAESLQRAGMTQGSVLTLVGKNHPETLFWLLAAMQKGIRCALTMPQPLTQLHKKLTSLYGSGQAWVWLAPSAGLTSSVLLQQRPKTQLVTTSTESALKTQSGQLFYHADQLATLIFTSGSTGDPKVVAHTHRQHFASAQGLLREFHFTQQDTWLLSLPLYHVSGLAIVYRWLYSGACLKMGNGNLAEDVKGVSHASFVATQLKRLLDSEQRLTLTHVLLGGGHVPHTLACQAAERGIDVWLGYGMTEAASTVTAKRADNTSSAGHVLDGRKIKLIDNRIYIGGDTLASGYYHQGELSPLKDIQGWFDSKDLGYWQDNELVIIGRADNQFISGGENIHCEEIEAVLNHHPVIQQAFIIPVMDETFGARPVAIVQSEQPFSIEEGNAWCESRLEKFKWPIHYLSMPEALTSSGIKVSRQALKHWLTEQYPQYVILK